MFLILAMIHATLDVHVLRITHSTYPMCVNCFPAKCRELYLALYGQQIM